MLLDLRLVGLGIGPFGSPDSVEQGPDSPASQPLSGLPGMDSDYTIVQFVANLLAQWARI
jgi:hypothetical protein